MLGGWLGGLHFEVLRDVNVVLAFVAVTLLGYRLGPLAVDPNRQTRRDLLRKTLLFILLLYVLCSGLGAAQSRILANKAGPLTLAFTLLHTTVIVICLMWPVFLREKDADA